MIVRDHPRGHLCLPQSQHAAISGQIARGWGNDEFAAPAPWTEVCLAAKRHDDGMDDFDAVPALDPETGLPRDFMSMPLDLWLGCWRRGPALVAEDDPYAGLLVALHGLYLLDFRDLERESDADRADAQAFRQETGELIESLVAEVGGDVALEQYLDAAAIERNRRFLALWDAMSLAVCMPRLPDAFEGVGPEGIEIHMEEVGIPGSPQKLVAVEPWPFELSEVPLAAAGRPLERTYEDPAEMHAALAAAPVEALTLTLVRA